MMTRMVTHMHDASLALTRIMTRIGGVRELEGEVADWREAVRDRDERDRNRNDIKGKRMFSMHR